MLYEEKIKQEVKAWQKKMSRAPSLFDKLSKRLQVKMNSYIPEKVHLAITGTIKAMVRGVLFGAKYVTQTPSSDSLLDAEIKVVERIKFYRNAAAAEGGVTGAGGILLGLVDFPVLLGMKLKLLFDIASLTICFTSSGLSLLVSISNKFSGLFMSRCQRSMSFLCSIASSRGLI